MVKNYIITLCGYMFVITNCYDTDTLLKLFVHININTYLCVHRKDTYIFYILCDQKGR